MTSSKRRTMLKAGAAIAGATLCAARLMGKLKGEIASTTPLGTLRT